MSELDVTGVPLQGSLKLVQRFCGRLVLLPMPLNAVHRRWPAVSSSNSGQRRFQRLDDAARGAVPQQFHTKLRQLLRKVCHQTIHRVEPAGRCCVTLTRVQRILCLASCPIGCANGSQCPSHATSLPPLQHRNACALLVSRRKCGSLSASACVLQSADWK